jgi:GntR family transcriptional regulator
VYNLMHMKSMQPKSLPPFQLTAASGVPFYRQVVDQVSDHVRSGRLPPGTRLPSVRELAKQLTVSLITVRRAYSDLEAAGLVQRRQGHGTFVSQDIDEATHEDARRDARDGLVAATDRALELGLPPEDVLATVQSRLPSNRS